MRQLIPVRPAREAAAFLAAWTVLASFLLLTIATGPLRVAGFQGIASAWAWWSYLLAGAPHPFPLLSLMGPGPSFWSWLPAMILTTSGFGAFFLLAAVAQLGLLLRCSAR